MTITLDTEVYYVSDGVRATWPITFTVDNPVNVRVQVIDGDVVDNVASFSVDLSTNLVIAGPFPAGKVVRVFLTNFASAPDQYADEVVELNAAAKEIASILARGMHEAFSGNWTTGVTYRAGSIVIHGNSSWIASRATVDEEPGLVNSPWVKFATLPPSMTWVGPWASSTVYNIAEAVENGGQSYVCKTDHTSSASNEPGVGSDWTTYWDLLAKKGADGQGNVNGPASATDGNIAIFDGTSGKLLKDTGNTVASITVSETSPRVNLTETNTGAYGRVQLTNGKLKLQVTNADGTANAGGTIQLSGYAGADIAKLEVIKNGALKEIWDDDNFAARIAALTQNTTPAGTESVACDDGKRVALDDIAALASAFTGGNLANPGYVQFSNGLILQWNSSAAFTLGTSYVDSLIYLSFPITFPNSVFACCVNLVSTESSRYISRIRSQISDLNTSLVIVGCYNDNSITMSLKANCIAIGY